MASSGASSKRLEVRIVGSSLDEKKNPNIWREYQKTIPNKEECAIVRCTDPAKVGGHVWVRGQGRGQYCYIVPICKKHATNSKLHYPDPLKIFADVRPEKGNSKTSCGCSDALIPGEVYCGQYKVLNVGSSLDRKKEPDHWTQYRKQIPPGQTCRINGCGEGATKGGHMWVKERDDCCFILPVCEEHARPSKLQPDYPQYMQTNQDALITVAHTKDKCKCSKDLIPGEVYRGSYPVTNVEGSSIDNGGKTKKRYWKDCTGEDFPDKCQLQYCRKPAEDGAHVWVKERDDFCFIVPFCRSHNTGDKKFTHRGGYKPTLIATYLVVFNPKEKCGCPKSGCARKLS